MENSFGHKPPPLWGFPNLAKVEEDFLSGLSAKKSTFTCSHQISAPLLNPWPLSTWTPQSSSFSPSWPEKKDWEGRKVLQESEAAGPDVQAELMQCSSISIDISQYKCLKVCHSFFFCYISKDFIVKPQPPVFVAKIYRRWTHLRRTPPDALPPQQTPVDYQSDIKHRFSKNGNVPVAPSQMLLQICKCRLQSLDPGAPFKINPKTYRSARSVHLATRVAERIKVERSLNATTSFHPLLQIHLLDMGCFSTWWRAERKNQRHFHSAPPQSWTWDRMVLQVGIWTESHLKGFSVSSSIIHVL